MTRTSQVVWSDLAARDLESLAAYVAEHDLEAALVIFEKLEARARRLKSMPQRGRLVPELLALGVTRYREIIEPPYRLVYGIEGSKVIIVAAIDGRRDLESVLHARLLGL